MILSFVTPFDDRCYRVAVEIVRDDWCKPKVDALPKDGFHEAFGILREFHKWVLTPEGVARIEQEIGRVKLILKPEITRDDLETTLPKYAARSK
jgi:hypothetical protein